MIQAVVGSGGKTTLIHRLAAEARARGRKGAGDHHHPHED